MAKINFSVIIDFSEVFVFAEITSTESDAISEQN